MKPSYEAVSESVSHRKDWNRIKFSKTVAYTFLPHGTWERVSGLGALVRGKCSIVHVVYVSMGGSVLDASPQVSNYLACLQQNKTQSRFYPT
jgi:hypothetical protein